MNDQWSSEHTGLVTDSSRSESRTGVGLGLCYVWAGEEGGLVMISPRSMHVFRSRSSVALYGAYNAAALSCYHESQAIQPPLYGALVNSVHRQCFEAFQQLERSLL